MTTDAALETFTHDGLRFAVADAGPADGRVVIALHGFPEDRHAWEPLTARLAGAGYRVLAPDQRGYSPGARPSGRRAYTVDRLTGDVLALADAASAQRFDLIGHDWGALVAWDLAARRPDRVRTLTAMSVPHPRAVQHAARRTAQALRSWYVLAFQIPVLPEAVLRLLGAERAAGLLVRDGLDATTAHRYAAVLSSPVEMTPRINWYRALPLDLRHLPPAVAVPTLYVWGTGDQYIHRHAASQCGRFVEAPYRFEVLEGTSHWLPSTASDRIAPLLLDHLANN
jgi:pimeloyl-ACP methyl ester carboxylesterase